MLLRKYACKISQADEVITPFFPCSAPNSLDQLKMTFLVEGWFVGATNLPECRCARAGENGWSMQKI